MSSTASFVESLVFWIAAVSAVASGVGVITARSPVYSALALILTLAQLAVFYLLLNAQFIAAAQILIYAGAVMVLFLFVITLLGIQTYDLIGDTFPAQRVVSVLLAGLLLTGLIFFVVQAPGAVTGLHAGFDQQLRQDNVRAFGQALFTDFVFPFELTALLLIVAMIGAVSLGRRRSGQFDEVLTRIESPREEPPDQPASVPVREPEPTEV